jgi:isopenicillin N synthase-like dioxygenase
MHAAFRALPIVDVSGLSSPDFPTRQATAERLGAATRQAGFCYAVGHRVPPALSAGLVAAARAFFALPLERKMQHYIGLSSNHRGYVPEGEEVFYGGSRDRKEAFDLAVELPPQDSPMLGPNVWPHLAGFRAAVSDYYAAAFTLGRVLLRGFALAAGLDETALDRHVTAPPSQLRLVHYPFDPRAHDATGIGAHTDYECFTILLPTAPGLEVRNGEGEWIDAPPIPGGFIVNVGDMMEVWTNGAFVATSHRVRRVEEERYSFPLFFCTDYHTEIAPLPAFVSAERPARYPSLRAGEGARPLSSFGPQGT